MEAANRRSAALLSFLPLGVRSVVLRPILPDGLPFELDLSHTPVKFVALVSGDLFNGAGRAHQLHRINKFFVLNSLRPLWALREIIEKLSS